MKIYNYEKFIKESIHDIHWTCKRYNIKKYTINEDGIVDVDGDVRLNNNGLYELPLKFGKVSGEFDCKCNNLKTLEGSPYLVGGDFRCNFNKLTNLVGAPNSIGGHFVCSDNLLTSLEGSPISMTRGFGFYCFNNKLTSLEGLPKNIKGSLVFKNNFIRDVKGIPEEYGLYLNPSGIFDNPVYEIFKLFPEERWDEAIEHLNDYNVIRDGKVVILQALERVFWELDLEVPEIDHIEGYEIHF